MNFPHVIPKATRDVYEPSDLVILANLKRKIHSENFDFVVPTLRLICLNTIGKNYDILAPIRKLSGEDYNYLIEVLAIDVRLELVVDVEDDFYWKRRCEGTWPERIFESKDEAGYWKRLYCSKHLQDLIEIANVDDDLTKEVLTIERYVCKLTIEKLNEIKQKEGNREVPPLRENVDHFPLGKLLFHLSNLVELRFSFSIDSEGCLFEFSSQDAQMIASALRSLKGLKAWHVQKCRMNIVKVRILGRCLMDLKNLDTFEMNYCMLDDEAIKIISYVILNHENLNTIILADNQFGDEGFHALSYAISNAKHPIEHLDLRRNQMSDVGASHMASMLVHCPRGPREVVLSCCDLKGPAACLIAGSLRYNASVERLYVAANDFSGEAMAVLLDSLRFNSKLTKIDIGETKVNEVEQLKLEGIVLNSKKLKIVGYQCDL